MSCADKDSQKTNANEKETVVNTKTESPKTDIAALPSWAKEANIYEVNIRQYTPEGTFNAFSKHLDRLQKMGVDILWLMPVFPIGQKKKKGEVGSPYAVADYEKVNPDYGSMADFDAMVKKAHSLGMKVILDWVPNHTAWDNPWITAHPEWYTMNGDTITHPRNEKGEPTDWYDVADLNYDNKDMRAAMIDALGFWIRKHSVDGYRCDVAFFVPDDFWVDVSAALRQVKSDVFLLAESEHPENRNSGSFHMSYSWSFHHIINDIAKGKKGAKDVYKYLEEDAKKFSKGFHMNFTSNHDENSWNGTVFERMGEAHKCLAALTFVMEGMPLVYGGQEAPLKHRLSFFGKDEIKWGDYAYADFYKELIALKKNNKALWNGTYGGKMKKLDVGNDKLFSFTRTKDGNTVLGVFNLTGKEQAYELSAMTEKYTNALPSLSLNIGKEKDFTLKPWEYIILKS